jgi:hypothetical protein
MPTVHCPKCSGADIRERNIAVASLPVTAWDFEDDEVSPAGYDTDVGADWEIDTETEHPYVCYDCMWEGSLDALIVRPTHDETVRQIARRFGALILRDASDEERAFVLRKNGTPEYPLGGACPTHDIADANEWMGEAFRAIVGRDSDPASDDDSALWNAAWNLAREHNYYFDAPTDD